MVTQQITKLDYYGHLLDYPNILEIFGKGNSGVRLYYILKSKNLFSFFLFETSIYQMENQGNPKSENITIFKFEQKSQVILISNLKDNPQQLITTNFGNKPYFDYISSIFLINIVFCGENNQELYVICIEPLMYLPGQFIEINIILCKLKRYFIKKKGILYQKEQFGKTSNYIRTKYGQLTKLFNSNSLHGQKKNVQLERLNKWKDQVKNQLKNKMKKYRDLHKIILKKSIEEQILKKTNKIIKITNRSQWGLLNMLYKLNNIQLVKREQLIEQLNYYAKNGYINLICQIIKLK